MALKRFKSSDLLIRVDWYLKTPGRILAQIVPKLHDPEDEGTMILRKTGELFNA